MVPPFTWSTNSKPLPRASRLDLEEYLAELACAARLLLVAMMALGLGGYRFAIGECAVAWSRPRACTASASCRGCSACADRPGRGRRFVAAVVRH
jgi:hypothetical protein